LAVLVLGAYGLIGRRIVSRLVSDGFEVIGLGRDIKAVALAEPRIVWRRADIARLTEARDWAPLLEGVDAVVNAVGALQTGLKDKVEAVQDRAMTALYAAAAATGVRRIVQISAPGVRPDATTLFLRSKAAADGALRNSGLDHVILRPVLVIGPAAYGGTALLRGLAAFPFLTPLIAAGARVRTVSVDSVADATARALRGEIASGANLVLAESGSHSLAEVVGQFRQWLGLRVAPSVPIPGVVGALVGAAADMAGWLGWRSPLRSTAMVVMRDGVAPPDPGQGPSLAEILANMPATPQEKWFARLWLLKPAIIIGLSVFWIASGWIGLARQDEASRILTDAGVSPALALTAVLAGSMVDMGLGLAVLLRPTSKVALLGMVVVSLAYMAGSALLSPGLWLDPLGPMVKTALLILLYLVALAILEER
jgi:uncharacterized protein YbjT (DUF2867 family)